MTSTETASIREADAMPEAERVAKRDALLASWEKAKTEAAKWKELEMQFRTAFVEFASDPDKKTGAENIELANGFKAKIVKKQNMSLAQDTVNSALDKLEALGDNGKFVAERIVKWKAELSKTEYDNLSQAHKKIMDEVITITDGSPTLEIVSPKSKKVL